MKKKSKRGGVRNTPISRSLRQTIRERGLTAYAAAKQAGVSVDAVQRFLNAERGLSLATADKLADAFALTLCPDDRPPSNEARDARSSPSGPEESRIEPGSGPRSR
ncbi:MAG: helix-turn-helix transcriptional regulator [Isosphaeraceae bacterium]|nr:helix-turn-helix transcriptional regulator [Isosphaeraceae bacterium]